MTEELFNENLYGSRGLSNGDCRSAACGQPPSHRELKPEQQLAAHTLDRHVAVTAGPGAGKTTVLVERYLHILRTLEIGVDQIVAITFTNRAANEMRERLRAELDKLLHDASTDDRRKWMRHKRTLEGAMITTIHGFCARLLREFPVEADIDPQFILLDAHRSAMLEEAVVEEALTEFISSGHQAITELAAGAGRGPLVRGLIDIYRSMRNQGLNVDKLQSLVVKNHATVEDYERRVEELAKKMREFIQTGGLSPAVDEKRCEAARSWPALLEKLLNAPMHSSLAEFTEAVQKFRDCSRPGAQGKKIRDLIKELDELIWKDRLGGLVPQTFLDLHAKRLAAELIAVVGAIERRLDEEKRRQSALDFDDLQVRALELLEAHSEVVQRTSRRYRFFLVDEFQDTNTLQRDLMARLALGSTDFTLSDDNLPQMNDRMGSGAHANLFIVGDRKQSIYGFRGADVDVFREMTARIELLNGLPLTLNRNFRSQRPLITLFNFLFKRVFEQDGAASDVSELGYVEHEASLPAREDQDTPPLVELLIDVGGNDRIEDVENSDTGNRPIDRSQPKPRERDANQVAERIALLVGKESIGTRTGKRAIEYRDVALLFRAMTEVHIYEAALRREGIPYVTVDGKGFYAREEITDFIQLLRFLDNKTDEVALAAVLRSPICGLSDDTLLALRCQTQQRHNESIELPLSVSSEDRERGWSARVRPLLQALRDHESIEAIDQAERPAIDRARQLLDEMIEQATRSRVSDLLRLAVEASEYRIVAAANFDGGQRLANIEKLFTLAERFEGSGAYTIRDFVRFVHDFEEAGRRESEGQIDDSADAVRLMSIHQSKGLEFPVVFIPDLHRQPDNRRAWWALDRHRGLTLKVPDGTGKLAAGRAYTAFGERAKLREEFESMRLLYVAATRAQERLILSGAVKDLSSIRSSWLAWICKALAIGKDSASGIVAPADDVLVQLTVNLCDAAREQPARPDRLPLQNDLSPPADQRFPLLDQIEPQPARGFHRFNVTQLLNYDRCPRQYFFDKVLHTPIEDEVGFWNDADAPEPPANLTAALRGAVIHRFCERFTEGNDVRELLERSFEEVLSQRAAELADRVIEIDRQRAVQEMLPLALNYVGSFVRERIESARAFAQHSALSTQNSPLGVLSEQRFRIRRPLGILTGTIDKLLVCPVDDGGLRVEIIDFKTNRFRPARGADTRERTTSREGQLSFGFLESSSDSNSVFDLVMQSEVKESAADYRMQMQAYALAVRELLPEVRSIRATLHFLHPNAEVTLEDHLVERELCANAIDETLLRIVSSSSPENFPAQPGDRCRRCNFLALCSSGRRWVTGASEAAD